MINCCGEYSLHWLESERESSRPYMQYRAGDSVSNHAIENDIFRICSIPLLLPQRSKDRRDIQLALTLKSSIGAPFINIPLPDDVHIWDQRVASTNSSVYSA